MKLTDPLPGLGNDSWHTWALRWTPTELTFYYDDAVTWTMTRPISRQAQYLILSSEVGEFFAGQIPAGGYGTRATSTTNMQVDYVRAYTPATPPANTAAPVMTGTPEVDQTLSCSSGAWSGNPAPSLAYEWLRDDAPIPGASSPTYVLQVGDARHELGCRVTATNPAGSISAVSSTLLIRNRPLTPAAPQLAPALGSSALGARAAAAPTTGAADTTAPTVKLSTRRSQRLSTSITVTIACPRENCRASTRATIRPLWPSVGPTRRLASVSTTIAKGYPVTVRLRLSSRMRRDGQTRAARPQAHGRAAARPRRRRRRQRPHADTSGRSAALTEFRTPSARSGRRHYLSSRRPTVVSTASTERRRGHRVPKSVPPNAVSAQCGTTRRQCRARLELELQRVDPQPGRENVFGVVAIALQRLVADPVENDAGLRYQLARAPAGLLRKATSLAVADLVGRPGNLAHVIVAAGLQRGRGQDDDDDSEDQDPAHTGQLTR